jgi:hypothetical protein
MLNQAFLGKTKDNPYLSLLSSGAELQKPTPLAMTITDIWILLKDIFLSDSIFYTRCATITIILVFVGTYVSNHVTRWKIIRWNMDNPQSPVFFDVEDTIWGFRVKVVLRPKEERPTLRKSRRLVSFH